MPTSAIDDYIWGMPPRGTIGFRLRQLRVEARVSQNELASWLNIGQGQVSSLENGRFDPTLNTLRKYGRVFSLKLSEILEGVH